MDPTLATLCYLAAIALLAAAAATRDLCWQSLGLIAWTLVLLWNAAERAF